MKRTILLVLLSLISILIAACRQDQAITAEDIQIDVKVVDEQLSVGDATLQISVTDKDSKPINNARLAIRGDMNHAGMTPVLRDVSTATEGVYEVPFEWTMAGDWSVEVTVTLTNGDTARQTFSYSVLSASMDMNAMNHDNMNMGETSAAYFSISNYNDNPQVLIGVSSSVAHLVELHETTIVNDIASMSPIESVTIPAGETVEFMPAGKHIMLMDLTQNLVIGDEVELKFQFESGEDVTMTAIVQDMLMDDLPQSTEANGLLITNVWVRPAMAGAMQMDVQTTPESGE